MKLAYCDYIAETISRSVDNSRVPLCEGKLKASKPHMDLHPEEGYMLSTKRTITVVDHNDKRYIITVEEEE